MGSPLWSMTCLTIGFWTKNGVRYRFHRVNHVLNLMKKWLVTFMTFVPLAGLTAGSDNDMKFKKEL